MSDKTNIMPNNLDAEQALLGCMLIDNDILADILEQLKDTDFYQESHQYILTAMKIVYSERKPVDIVTLADRLESDKNLEKAGGIAYLTELAQITPSAANYRHYFGIVKRDATNRALIRASREIIEFSKESDDEIKSTQFAEAKIYGISKNNDTSSLKDIREGTDVEYVLDKFEKLASDRDAFHGINTGFTRLDKLTNGLQRSDLIVIAARPGMGKTSFAMNIIEHAAIHEGCVCAVFSLEMPSHQIVQRLICANANVSMANALSGKLEPSDWKKLIKSSEELKKSKIIIDDSSRVTPAEISSKCKRIKAKNNNQLDLVMVDYIQLMSSGSGKKDLNRTNEIAEITRNLKIMAKELNVPVLALSQLHRIATKEPQVQDLRDSGAIEQDADIVMLLNRPDVGATPEEISSGKIVKGAAEVNVAKHRNGATERIKLRFKGELTKFVNPTNEEYEGGEPDFSQYSTPEYESAPAEDMPNFEFSDDEIPFEE